MFSRDRQRAAQQQWAEWETDDYVTETIREVQRRQAAGDRRAAKHVALDALEEVWVRTGFRRLANLAYKRTLAIGRQAERSGHAAKATRGHDGSRRGAGRSPREPASPPASSPR
jgi:hypothetical protein